MSNLKIDAYLKKNIDEVPIKHNIYNILNGLYAEPRGIYKNIDVDVIQTHKSLSLLYSENKNALVEASQFSKPKRGGAPQNYVFLF